MKTIDTLIPDIYKVVEGHGGWDSIATTFLSEGIAGLAEERFFTEQKVRDYLSPSNIGSTCSRELWYTVNQADKAEAFNAETLGTFFYGDILEKLVIALAIAAGHKVEGLQERIEVAGVSGSGDCIIDGWVVDVKSASSFSFQKFARNFLKEEDPFGYISQLSSYLYGYKDNPAVVEKNKAAFLVVKKDRFKLHLDVYDLTSEVANKEAEVKAAQEMTKGPIPPRLPAEPDGKSGNYKLGTKCSYCRFKMHCWDNLRVFAYSEGPRYLTHVAKRPRDTVEEIT